jgi:hypothetical protein
MNRFDFRSDLYSTIARSIGQPHDLQILHRDQVELFGPVVGELVGEPSALAGDPRVEARDLAPLLLATMGTGGLAREAALFPGEFLRGGSKIMGRLHHRPGGKGRQMSESEVDSDWIHW